MIRTGSSVPNGNGFKSVDSFPNAYRQQYEVSNNLQYMSTERWDYLLKKVNDLSDKADLIMVIVGSMERSFDSLCSRFEDLEMTMSSIVGMQLSIANVQLDLEKLEHRYLRSSTTASAGSSSEANGNTSGIRKTNSDAKKRSGLVVEDSERAAKAAEGTERKEASSIHLNGNSHRANVTPQPLSQSTFRSRFTIPRVPSTYGGVHTETTTATGCSGDTVDTVLVTPKTKLKSFQERKEPYRQEYYHDARFLQSEVSLGSSGESVEKDDEGDHHEDNVNPPLKDMKEKSSMYVHLPQKPLCTDLPPSLQDPLVDQFTNQLTNQSPGKDKKQSNNNKEPEAEVESSCAVDCLYYTLQCCDCSIM